MAQARFMTVHQAFTELLQCVHTTARKGERSDRSAHKMPGTIPLTPTPVPYARGPAANNSGGQYTVSDNRMDLDQLLRLQVVLSENLDVGGCSHCHLQCQHLQLRLGDMQRSHAYPQVGNYNQ
jgi:hypothetical protein